MDVLGPIITAGVAIMAVGLLAVVTGQTISAFPAFDPNKTAWAETMTTVETSAAFAFSGR